MAKFTAVNKTAMMYITLLSTRKLLSNHSNWNWGTHRALNVRGYRCEWDSAAACKWSLTGAVQKSNPYARHGGPYELEQARKLDKDVLTYLSTFLDPKYMNKEDDYPACRSLARFNTDIGTLHSDVMSLLDKALEGSHYLDASTLDRIAQYINQVEKKEL
jgi:hypothetical protein